MKNQAFFAYTVLVCALLLASPTLFVFFSWLSPQWQTWQHIVDNLLTDYFTNTFGLALGVGVFTAFVGTVAAWFVSQFEFHGRKVMQWCLLLPLAIPAYINAYTYSGMLDYFGVVQTLTRELFGSGSWVPEIQSLPGAIFVMSLVLFPYVYALALVAFSQLPQSHYEVAKNHGKTEGQFFVKIALPLAFPAIFAGAMLSIMEAFAEFGVVDYFGVPTLTTGVFKVWFGMGDRLAAAQLSALMVSFILFLLLLEHYARRKQKLFSNKVLKSISRRPISKTSKALGVYMFLISLLALAFVFPVTQLLYWAYLSILAEIDYELLSLLLNSFKVAIVAACAVTLLCVFMSALARFLNRSTTNLGIKIVSLGYAFPGAVIAVGAMIVLSSIDRQINVFTQWLFEDKVGLILSGSLFALIFAYVVRFATVGLQYVQSGYLTISPHMEEAAQSLGKSKMQIFTKVHIPILSPTLAAATLVVFVDVLKELPATLILRPFNFNTLSVKTYELASDERLTDASVPALLIILIGLIPVVLIGRNKIIDA